VAVTVGAVEDVAGPPVAEARDVGQLVPQAGRDEQPPGRNPIPVGQQNPEPAPTIRHQVTGGAGDDVAPVPCDLLAAGGDQFGWYDAVA